MYSIDKIVQNFKLRKDGGQALMDRISGAAGLVYDHWNSLRPGTYRDQWSIKTDTGQSFWLGMGLNVPQRKPQWLAVRMEYNPNKVLGTREFNWVFNNCMSLCKYTDVKQFDLAVDIPVSRENVVLLKDGRLYEEHAHSASDRTQYAGQRNAPGRVKLYNKQIESQLDKPLTRLEVTLCMDDLEPGEDGPKWPGVVKRWPRVLVTSYFDLAQHTAGLNGTDLFIFKTLLMEPERLQELSRVKRQKFRALLGQCGGYLSLDEEAFSQIVERLAEQSGFVASKGRPVFARNWYEAYENEIDGILEYEPPEQCAL